MAADYYQAMHLVEQRLELVAQPAELEKAIPAGEREQLLALAEQLAQPGISPKTRLDLVMQRRLVLTVQTLLEHKHVDTTLGYARLYDGSVAADYYRAMREVEQRLAWPEDLGRSAPSPGELLALVDALRAGMLTSSQADTVHSLRTGILGWADESSTIQMGDVKVPAYPE